MTYEYNAQVVRWVDGDTPELDADLGFHIRYRDHFRLLGVDTAERGHPLAAEGKALSMSLAPEGSTVRITTTKGDKYGRWLTTVTNEAGLNVSDELLKANLAKPYWGGTKEMVRATTAMYMRDTLLAVSEADANNYMGIYPDLLGARVFIVSQPERMQGARVQAVYATPEARHHAGYEEAYRTMLNSYLLCTKKAPRIL